MVQSSKNTSKNIKVVNQKLTNVNFFVLFLMKTSLSLNIFMNRWYVMGPSTRGEVWSCRTGDRNSRSGGMLIICLDGFLEPFYDHLCLVHSRPGMSSLQPQIGEAMLMDPKRDMDWRREWREWVVQLVALRHPETIKEVQVDGLFPVEGKSG